MGDWYRSTVAEVLAFVNGAGNGQVITDDACPSCGYPERHRAYQGDSLVLIADGCPSCATSRMPEPSDS